MIGRFLLQECGGDHLVQLPGAVGVAAGQGHIGEDAGELHLAASERGGHRVVGAPDRSEVDDAAAVGVADGADHLFADVVGDVDATGPREQLGERRPALGGA